LGRQSVKPRSYECFTKIWREDREQRATAFPGRNAMETALTEAEWALDVGGMLKASEAVLAYRHLLFDNRR